MIFSIEVEDPEFGIDISEFTISQGFHAALYRVLTPHVSTGQEKSKVHTLYVRRRNWDTYSEETNIFLTSPAL